MIFNVCSNVSLYPNIWKHWLLMQKQKLLPGEQKYFLPNSETFDETTLFLRLPTLARHIPKYCIGKTNINMTNILRNNVSQFVPGSEAAEAGGWQWRGIGQKGHFCI
jgi:hypothetical protein